MQANRLATYVMCFLLVLKKNLLECFCRKTKDFGPFWILELLVPFYITVGVYNLL